MYLLAVLLTNITAYANIRTMATKELKVTKSEKPSLLDQFKLGYEYNESWHEAKKAIKTRTQR